MRATPREAAGVIGFSLWTIVGLFLDGYAHQHLTGLETFFTPWHGVFYSGFTFLAAWLVHMVWRRRPRTTTWRAAVPRGYLGSLVALPVFAAGGVGDGIWHTLRGVESSIDALLSPTHLVMLVALLVVLTGPVRAATSAASPDGRPGTWRTEWPVVAALTLSTALAAFFVAYLWVPGETWTLATRFDPDTGVGMREVMLGVGGALVSTVVLTGPVAWLASRRRPPVGACVMLLGAVNLLMVLAFEMGWTAVAAGVAAGAAADAAGRLSAGTVRRVVVPGVAAAVLWATVVGGAAVAGALAWPAELWSGLVVLCTLLGGGLGVLAGGRHAAEATTSPVEAPAHGVQAGRGSRVAVK